jgi:hypothetical protein
MERTDEELDKMHDAAIEALYEVFEDELTLYFRFRNAAIDILACGDGHFPFSTHYSCIMKRLDDILDSTEKNIEWHFREQFQILFDERIEKSTSEYSEQMKKDFNHRLKQKLKRITSSFEEF